MPTCWSRPAARFLVPNAACGEPIADAAGEADAAVSESASPFAGESSSASRGAVDEAGARVEPEGVGEDLLITTQGSVDLAGDDIISGLGTEVIILHEDGWRERVVELGVAPGVHVVDPLGWQQGGVPAANLIFEDLEGVFAS